MTQPLGSFDGFLPSSSGRIFLRPSRLASLEFGSHRIFGDGTERIASTVPRVHAFKPSTIARTVPVGR
jgi:hypothetical protein